MTGRLDGKVAVVTGAGSAGPGWGNGRATAVLFAREGAHVFAVDRDTGAMAETLELIEAEGGTVRPYGCDVTSSAAVAEMVAACRDAYGRIDVLVNNVGGSRPGGAAELPPEEWEAQLRFNVTSTYLTCHHVVPVLRDGGGGAIVNTASTSGLRFSGSPQAGYAAAKAAVIQFSRVTAVQYAADGIRVNTVVPGQLHTPMVEARLAGQRAGGDVGTLLNQRASRVPLPVEGDGRDTAYASLFLASGEARFVTGTEIVVDGGMSARCD